MKDKYNVSIEDGVMIQFDDDYFGHGLTRFVYKNDQGVLGFRSTPESADSFCYVKDWLKEIEVVTEKTVMRRQGKQVTLNGRRYFW